MNGETILKRDICRGLIASHLCVVWSTPAGWRPGVRLAPAFTADVTGYTLPCGGHAGGRFCAFEIKTAHGRTSRGRAAGQLEWREAVRRAGGFAFEVRSLAEAVESLRNAMLVELADRVLP